MSVQYVTAVKRRGSNAQDTFITVPGVDVIVELSKPTDGSEPRKINRKIQYALGETSIYADEQSDTAKPQTIIIQGNIHYVNEDQITKLAYLDKCNYNLSNPHRRTDINGIIRRYDRSAIFQKGLDEKDLIMDARFKVKEMDLDELKAFLLLTADNPAHMKQLDRMSTQEIRHTAYSLAEGSPAKFLQEITDVKSKDKLTLMRAITSGEVIHSIENNSLSWASGLEILRLPLGFNVIDTFVEKAGLDAAFSDILDMIKGTMKLPEPSDNTVAAPPELTDMYMMAIDRGIKSDLIEKNGKFFKYDGEEYNGVKDLKTALKENNMALFGQLMTEVDNIDNTED